MAYAKGDGTRTSLDVCCARASRKDLATPYVGLQVQCICHQYLLALPMQEITKGNLPYLYGGKPPGCKNCKSTEFVSKFCQYGMLGHGQCDKGQIYYLVQLFLDREFYEILQFTPCDLWPLLKGRTLYFSGDSQTQVALQHGPGPAASADSSLLCAALHMFACCGATAWVPNKPLACMLPVHIQA